MGKREKLIASIRHNPKDISFEEIDILLRYFGCSVRQKARGGSHYKYTHPAVNWILEIPKDKPIKAIYARRALDMIDEIKEAYDSE